MFLLDWKVITGMKDLKKDHEEMSNKYLSLYDENDKLQELLNTMQFRI